MPKKFEPSAELLERILSRYKETNNYSLVSRETGISVAIIKRLIQEAEQPVLTSSKGESSKKPATTKEILAYRKQYFYTGLPPIETTCPKKSVYYGQMAMLKQEFLDV